VYHVWTYVAAGLYPGLANSGPRVTSAYAYPAYLCGLIDDRRAPRCLWRAVGQGDYVLAEISRSRRDKEVAKCLLMRLLEKQEDESG
jgi:hypothetical protein